MEQYAETSVEIVDVGEDCMVQYILSARDRRTGKWRHIAGMVDVGDQIPVSEMLERTYGTEEAPEHQ